ncbi:GGDEF domain-containing response regulator [Catellatospora tritici]|uniref:GGDEF domain-containing response regulator n=1 Tax=Catellatospora tritici TaxID=2851566 RepID=UPI0020C1E242|nr:response regulator [Catellatospora tritici]
MTTEPHGSAAEVILVVDDDPDIVRVVEVNLRLHGFDVMTAHSGAEALDVLENRRPDLAIVDLMMPGMDGLELTRRLRADPMVTALPIIVLTAKALTSDKVAGLAAGADDYVVKPFDTSELIARVRATLRRNQEAREVSPLTGLAGNTRILREIADRLKSGTDYAVCYIDIDRFKAVNDVYGFGRGDQFISSLARSLRRATVAAGLPPAFLGHVGGDDFVVVCHPLQLKPITTKAILDFEAAADELYDPIDAARGYLEMVDRRGKVFEVNLVTLSIGVALSTMRVFEHPGEVVAVASEMKTKAKKVHGSYVAIDQRTDRLVLPSQREPESDAAAEAGSGA